MFIRRDRKRLADGAERCYVSLAHSVWEPVGDKKRSRPVIFARLGVEDDLDTTAVRGMRDALDRYLQKRIAEEAAAKGEAPPAPTAATPVERVADDLRPRLQPLRFLVSVDYGLRVLVEPVWKRLGLRNAMLQVSVQHDVTYDFERLVFGMVLNRLVDPKSKLACNEWLQNEAYFPEAEDWDVQHFYRALDILHDHAEEIDGVVMRAVRDRLPAEDLKLLLVDTTSSYFESDYDDRERAQIQAEWEAHDQGDRSEPMVPRPQVVNRPPLRLRGKSKDKRPDKPQVVIATVSTADGRPLRNRTYAGNRQDQTILLDVVADATEIDDGAQVVVVSDAGMSGAKNLKALDAQPDPPHWLCAVSVRTSKFGKEQVLAKKGRMRPIPESNFTYRAETFSADDSPSGRPEVWVVTRNELSADRERRNLARHVQRVEAVLAKDNRADSHGKEVCELQTKRHLKRFVTKSKDGKRLLLDRKRVRREKELAGVRLYRSTLADRDPRDVFAAYQALLKLEDDFKTYKGPLRLRPMHHRAARRIKAHVMVCSLALLVLRELEVQTGLRFEQLRAIFQPVRAALVEQEGLRFWQRSEWDVRAEEVLEQLGITPGPRTWGAHRPEPDERVRDGPP